ncbi:KAP family P-loop NTPase fold protein [Methanomethylophilus alvi]|uniref:KAP family P-loop NTPase fold protein n=1 Tax=Methanomethylophilus alvi TaxID=1291540 RepID=UPI0037DC75AE
MDRCYYEVPIECLDSDLLNRKDLVDAIATIIRECDVGKSTSIGLCGKWGTGKTSVINMVCNLLKDDESIKIVNFNPWLYTDQIDLTKEFFNVFSAALPGKRSEVVKRIGKKINKAIELMEPLEVLCESIPLFPLVKYYSKILSGNDDGVSLSDMKKIISEKLSKEQCRYVIVIDDLDRLDKSEIMMILKLVRSLADFSNTIYLLSYDEEIVSKAADTEIFKGSDYLHKIIHLPITLPETDRDAVVESLVRQYAELTSDSELDKHTSEVFRRCILPYVLTLRDVNVVFNRYRIKYELSKGNTHPAELLAVTVLEYSNSSVYKWVCENRYTLCGMRMPSAEELMNKSVKSSKDLYLNDQMSAEYIDCLSTLFPTFDNSNLHMMNRDELISEHRICHFYFIDNYFILSLSSKKITNDDLEGLLYKYDATKAIELLHGCSLINGKLGRLLEELSSKYSVATNLSIERKKLLSDLILFSDTYYTTGTVFPVDSYYYQSAGFFVKRYCETLPCEDVKTYLVGAVSFGDIVGQINAFWVIHHSDVFEEEDPILKDILSEIVERILTNDMGIKHLPIKFEFLMMIYAIGFINPDAAKKVFNNVASSKSKIIEYICAAREYQFSSEGLAFVIPDEYRSDEEISPLMKRWLRHEW